MRWISKFYKAYKSVIIRYPISSQALQTGIIVSGGDAISQTLVEKKKNYDYKRTMQYFAVGMFYLGPLLTVWYRILDRYVGTGGKFYGLKKMCLDQACFAPIGLAGFLASISTLQGKDVPKTFKEVYLTILIANYKLWPAVQIINFYFMPLHFQVLYAQIVALFWNTYVCYTTKPTEDE